MTDVKAGCIYQNYNNKKYYSVIGFAEVMGSKGQIVVILRLIGLNTKSYVVEMGMFFDDVGDGNERFKFIEKLNDQ